MPHKVTKDDCKIIQGFWKNNECVISVSEEDDSDRLFKGSYNSMNWGTLIRDPPFLFRPIINGGKYSSIVGSFDATEDHLSRSVCMNLSLGIYPCDKFIKNPENDVKVDLFSVRDHIVSKRIFEGTGLNKWEELK